MSPSLIQAVRLACAFVLSATSLAQAADTPTTTLTVRAYGTLAGNVGPIMQLRVDGVVVGTTEVRASEPADYPFLVPPLKSGSKIDVAYTNDAQVGGVDRNLFVEQLTAGTTFMLPTHGGVSYDLGSGSAAFDGANTKAGTTSVNSNGALRFSWPEPNLTDRLTIRASSVLAGNVGASMIVRVDGVVAFSAEVRATEPTDYVLAVPMLSAGSKIDVAFTNAQTVGGVARSLQVAYLMAGTSVLLPNASGVTLDLGSGKAAYDSANVQPGQAVLSGNGALRAKWPAANMTDIFSVRASGRMAGGVGPIMQVRVNGIVLGSVEVKATGPADFSFPTLPVKAGQPVDIVYTNDAVIGGEDRDLVIASAISGKTLLQPTGTGVVFDQGGGSAAFDGLSVVAGRNTLNTNGALRAAWPEPNLTDTLIVRARGTLAGNVGPIMQVLVDGIFIGSAEVRASENADHVFAVPPMSAGRKLDLVYANDGTIGSVDRNLFIAYVITRTTFLTPSAAGNTYDRGSHQAAFDGTDVVAASGNLFWNGALRATWPAPNITDSVTVRASATLAGNVGALMTLWVDGIPVSSGEVRSTTPVDYLMPTPPLKPGSQVALIFSNRGSVAGVERQLNIAYMIGDTSFVTPNTAGATYNSGDLRATWPAPTLVDSITLRAYATLADNIGAIVQVRVNGVIVSTVEVRATTPTDYRVTTPRLKPGDKIDVAYINDTGVSGVDRNFFLQYIKTSLGTLVPTATTVFTDLGTGEAAFDGQGVAAATGALYASGALRFVAPAAQLVDANRAANYAASRFLQQATFGPTVAQIDRLRTLGNANWLSEQMAMPVTADYVNAIQAQYDRGDAFRPKGAQYNPGWVAQTFWRTAATSPDALRKRVAFALHQIFMISQADSNVYQHARAYAAYLDTLNQHAFGNFRNLLDDVALSPAMGIYLSHMRNRKENALSGRMPDENFAREVMQLFTIGLQELNIDGTPRLDGQGLPVETYSNDDVMAMAKVFTGWSWALPDAQLTETNFRFWSPDYSAANDQRYDTKKMKAYPGQHSTAEKRLFIGKPQALMIAANTSAQDSLKLTLDALFNHPNVGPFVSRQLIQRLVTSHPSNGYVARVASVFNNNGSGVRGDLAAVVRAILLDPETTNPPVGSIGKLREPVLRVAHWMRSCGATSTSGQFTLASELATQGQRAMYAPSVFGYFRPGFVPPNTAFSASRITVPEFQIVNESTSALWVNTALAMAGQGLGWTGGSADVKVDLQPLADLVAAGNVDGLIERLNLLLYAGSMSGTLKQDLLEALASVSGNDAASHLNRARVVLFLALASPEYLVQR